MHRGKRATVRKSCESPLLPTRDGKERAGTRIPSKRAIRGERWEMETARGERENEQRVNERRYARLPIPFPSEHAHERDSTKELKRTTRRVGASPARPMLSSR